VEFPFQCETVKQKAKVSSLEKYGFEYPSQHQEVKDKISISKVKHYQERRNSEGTDYSGIVYVLHFPHLSAVKIGLSSDFNERRRALKRDFGNFEIIQLMESDACFALESELHERFSEYRICLSEGGGRTEFFKEEILEML